MSHVRHIWLRAFLACLFISFNLGQEGLKCSFDHQTLPDVVDRPASLFIESNYGHWSSAKQQSGSGELKAQIRVQSAVQPHLVTVKDQDVWFWVHHQRYNLDVIEVHEPAGVERRGMKADAELRLVHSRSRFWSHIFGDDRLIVSIPVKRATNLTKESEFFHWLSGNPNTCVDAKTRDGKPWRDSLGIDCHDYSRYSLCTSDGHVGANWTDSRPKLGGQIFPLCMFLKLSEGSVYGFEHYSREHIDARDACCACGGGGFHGIWPKITNQAFLKFTTTCSGKATTWVVVDEPLYASLDHPLFSNDATSPSANIAAHARRASGNVSVTLDGLEVGEIFVDDQRFVITAEHMASSKETWRYPILLGGTATCVATVIVTMICVFSSRLSEYEQIEQKSFECKAVALLFAVVLLRWAAAIGLPLYVYCSGLVSAGAGFPWEVHLMFLVLLCALCVYQLLTIRPNAADSVVTYLACLIHGCLAILASYLEASFVVMAAAVLCPVYYANAEWPPPERTAMLAYMSLICFIYARLIFGLLVGLIGFMSYCCKDLMYGLAILGFRNNLELLGYWAVRLPSKVEETGEGTACDMCRSLFNMASTWWAHLLCFLAVFGHSLVLYIFGRTSGYQLPIVWASLACTMAQHLTRASGMLPSARKDELAKQ